MKRRVDSRKGKQIYSHRMSVVEPLDGTGANEVTAAFGGPADVLFVRCNVADEGDVESALRQVINWGGRLDALVNNAGLADPVMGAVEELALVEWPKRLDVNFTGPYLTAKHAVPHLRRTRGARTPHRKRPSPASCAR